MAPPLPNKTDHSSWVGREVKRTWYGNGSNTGSEVNNCTQDAYMDSAGSAVERSRPEHEAYSKPAEREVARS